MAIRLLSITTLETSTLYALYLPHSDWGWRLLNLPSLPRGMNFLSLLSLSPQLKCPHFFLHAGQPTQQPQYLFPAPTDPLRQQIWVVSFFFQFHLQLRHFVLRKKSQQPLLPPALAPRQHTGMPTKLPLTQPYLAYTAASSSWNDPAFGPGPHPSLSPGD